MSTEKIVSAATMERLQVLINRYFYSDYFVIDNEQAVNTKTGQKIGQVTHKKSRYTFYC